MQAAGEQTRERYGPVLFVDHSGLPGGGQLGLVRFLGSDAGRESRAVVLGAGTAFDGLPAGQVLQVSDQGVGAISAINYLRRAIGQMRPRVVVANSLRAAALLALLPHRKETSYIYYLRVDMSRDKMRLLRAIFLARILLPRFHGFVSNSEWTDSTIPRNLAGRPRRIAYPVSGSEQLADVRPLRSDRGRPFTVLSLSRVVAWKGAHVLVEAISLLSRDGLGDRVRAVIAGGTFHEDADYAERLVARAAVEAPNVSFVGHQSDVQPLLSEADVLVSCSLVAEPFGQVIAQGLASGRPVISTDRGGPREMIQDGENGFLVEPANAEALAAAIRELIENPARLQRMGEAARLSSLRFSDQVTTERLAAAIDEITEETERGRKGLR